MLLTNDMKFIEFLGHSGSGKSTLTKKLVTRNQYIGDTDIYDIQSWNTLSETKLINKYFQAARLLPRPARIVHGKLAFKYFRYHFIRDFFIENYNFISELLDFHSETYNEESTDKLQKFIQAILKYQVGKNMNKRDKYFCMDEGFYKKTAVMMGTAGFTDPPEPSYFDALPQPTVLIHVSPPPKIIKQRWKARDGIDYPISEIEKSIEMNKELVELAKKRGVKTVTVENMNAPKVVAARIHSRVME